MSVGIYDKIHCKNEWNFEVNTKIADIPLGDIVVQVGDCDIEVEIYGTDFVTTSGAPKDVIINVIELDDDIVSGGEPVVLNVDFLRANRNRAGKASIDCVDVVKGTVATPIVYGVSGIDGLNILRNGGTVTKSIPSFNPSPVAFFKYSLLRNTHYLIKTTATVTEESFIFGLFREL